MGQTVNAAKNGKRVVFFDFDNTISTFDVFDDMLVNFSRNDTWKKLEDKWRKGLIGSRECLEGQLKTINVSRKVFDQYLSRIKLDPYFERLIKLFKAKKVKTVILSDNFDYILNRVLRYNGFKKLKVYCNKLKFKNDSITYDFPFEHRNCKICAHCKTKNLLANRKAGSIMFYIGDGHSDICPAGHCDIIFAKERLLSHYKGKKTPCFAYHNLKDVYKYFKRSLA